MHGRSKLGRMSRFPANAARVLREPDDAIVRRVVDARSNRAQITVAIDQELGVPIKRCVSAPIQQS